MRTEKSMGYPTISALILMLALGARVPQAHALTLKEEGAPDCPKIEGYFQVDGLVCANQEMKKVFFELNPTGKFGNWLGFSSREIEVVLSGPRGEISAGVGITQRIDACEGPRKASEHTVIQGTLVINGVDFEKAAFKKGRRHRLSWSNDPKHPRARVRGLPRVIDPTQLMKGFQTERKIRLAASGNLYIETDWLLDGAQPGFGCILKLSFLSDRDGYHRPIGRK